MDQKTEAFIKITNIDLSMRLLVRFPSGRPAARPTRLASARSFAGGKRVVRCLSEQKAIVSEILSRCINRSAERKTKKVPNDDFHR